MKQEIRTAWDDAKVDIFGVSAWTLFTAVYATGLVDSLLTPNAPVASTAYKGALTVIGGAVTAYFAHQAKKTLTQHLQP